MGITRRTFFGTAIGLSELNLLRATRDGPQPTRH